MAREVSEPFRLAVRDRLIELKSDYGATRTAMAAKCLVTPGALAAIVSGERSPSLLTAANIARALGLDNVRLAEFAGPTPQPPGRKKKKMALSGK